MFFYNVLKVWDRCLFPITLRYIHVLYAGYAYLTSHVLFFSWSELCLGTRSTMASWDLVQSADQCSSFGGGCTAVSADTRFYFFCIFKKGHPHWHNSANEMSRAAYSPRGWRQDSTPQKLGCRRVCAHWEQSLHLSRGINRSRSLGNILAYCCSHHLNRETPAGLLAAL